MQISRAASPDVETHTNEQGGKQSHIPVRFDLIDGRAMFAMAEVLHQGAEKYGANNWRLIDIESHLNHLIMHAYAYLAGDRSDAHLSHIMCRAMFAQGVALQEDKANDPSFEIPIRMDSNIPKNRLLVDLPDGSKEVWTRNEDGLFSRSVNKET